jgi:hemin uptake protein HemP
VSGPADERRELAADLVRRAGLVIHSDDLFGSSALVLIKHREDWYRLMITKQGKLILTK